MPAPEQLERLPGSEVVLEGLADLGAGRDSANAQAVLMAADRLRAAGIEVPEADAAIPSHRLYALLAAEGGEAAHSRYNAIVRRLVSFCRAAERA